MSRGPALFLAPAVTSATGVAINLATDLRSNLVAWTAVVVLTVAATALAFWHDRRRQATPSVDAQQSAPAPVTNTLKGKVRGNVVQARDIDGPVILGGSHISVGEVRDVPKRADPDD